MLRFNQFLPTLFLLFFAQFSNAQLPLNDCANLGVETGTFDAWEGQYGTWVADYANNTAFFTSQYLGFDPESHRIRKVSDGFIPEVTSAQIPYVPAGSNYAIQLGNAINGGEYEQLRTSFLVDSSNSLYQYRFAVVFEDPGHLEVEQPRFELIVTDQYGVVIPCGYYSVTSASNIDGFQSEGKIRFRDWTTAAVDLRAFIGQVVTVTISNFDCSKGGHWGMALFDAACFEAKIQTLNYCPGTDEKITLAAPEGFQQYSWSNGMSGRVIEVPVTTATQDLFVEFSPYSSLHDSCRLSLKYQLPAGSDLIPGKDASLCQNGSVSLTANAIGEQFQYLWSPGGQTTKEITVSNPGQYMVQVTRNNCVLYDTIQVVQVEAPIVDVEAINPSCDGKNDGGLTASVSAGEEINYLWSTGSTSAYLQNLASGTYKLTVTGATTGCKSKIEFNLTQDKQVYADAVLLTAPFCLDEPVGKAKVTATFGTPPYKYAWSTGAISEVSNIPDAGQYKVTVTDSEGCQAVDEVMVKPIRAGIETTGNFCHDGKSGSIEINAFDGTGPYLYALGNGAFQTEQLFLGLSSGIYSVMVQDATGCERAFEAEVENLRPEPFNIRLPADSSILLGERMDIVAQPNYPISSIKWEASYVVDQPDSLTISVQPLKNNNVRVSAVDEHGCKSEDELILIVLKDYKMYIPNVFNPESGSEGDNRFYFSASGSQIKDVKKCQIFDRWGSMVFEDFGFEPNDSVGGWDGQKGDKELSPGVYAYRLEVEFIDGETRVFFGDVTLVR
jgi:CHU_C Type IX secretion signal domain/SprB repeat